MWRKLFLSWNNYIVVCMKLFYTPIGIYIFKDFFSLLLQGDQKWRVRQCARMQVICIFVNKSGSFWQYSKISKLCAKLCLTTSNKYNKDSWYKHSYCCYKTTDIYISKTKPNLQSTKQTHITTRVNVMM